MIRAARWPSRGGRIRRAGAGASLCAALIVQAPALAQENATAQAKTLFNAGAQAYERTQYTAAIQAFEQAYKLAPRPGILFSTAQAYRRRYTVDRRPEDVSIAIARYREYLDKVPQGGRRSDVITALAELEPLVARLPAPAAAGIEATAPGPAPGEGKLQTRLMISSHVEGAVVSVDGNAPAELPFIEEVAPGKHRVKVTAAGHFDDERQIAAAEGGVVALDIPLREKPALLTIAVEERADVSIDGRLVGLAPLPRPLEVSSGRHLVTVSRGGRRPFSREVELARDERRTVAVELEMTDQRYAAITLVGVSIAGAVVGGVIGAFALRENGIAEDIYRGEIEKGNASEARRNAYTDALGARDELRRAAGIALGVGALIGGAGALLFLTDFPESAPFVPRDEAPSPQRKDPGDATLEISAAPAFGPGFAGVAVGARF